MKEVRKPCARRGLRHPQQERPALIARDAGILLAPVVRELAREMLSPVLTDIDISASCKRCDAQDVAEFSERVSVPSPPSSPKLPFSPIRSKITYSITNAG